MSEETTETTQPLPERVSDLEAVPEEARKWYTESDLGYTLNFDRSGIEERRSKDDERRQTLSRKLTARERQVADLSERIAELEKSRNPSDELQTITKERDELKKKYRDLEEQVTGLQSKVQGAALDKAVRKLFSAEGGDSLLYDNAVEDTVEDARKLLDPDVPWDEGKPLRFVINGEPASGDDFVNYVRKNKDFRIRGATGQGGSRSSGTVTEKRQKPSDMKWEDKKRTIGEGGFAAFRESVRQEHNKGA